MAQILHSEVVNLMSLSRVRLRLHGDGPIRGDISNRPGDILQSVNMLLTVQVVGQDTVKIELVGWDAGELPPP